MGIKVIIGTNSSGKTYYAKNFYKDYEQVEIEKPSEDLKLSAANQMLVKSIVDYIKEDPNIKEKFNQLADELEDKMKKFKEEINKELNLEDFDHWMISEKNIDVKKEVSILEKSIHNYFKLEDSTMGSGHQTYLLLKIVTAIKSGSKFLFDEPEKYLHPSLIKKFAIEIKKLSKTSDIVVITHSVEMASNLIDDISEIEIKNPHKFSNGKWDVDYSLEGPIFDSDFWDKIANELNSYVHSNSINISEIIKKFTFNDKCQFKDDFIENDKFDSEKIKLWHRKYLKEIIETVFWKNVVLSEGLIEKVFISEFLRERKEFNISSFGKTSMPVIAEILKALNIDVKILFDEDDESEPGHENLNKLIDKFNSLKFIKDFETELQVTLPDYNKYSYNKIKEAILVSPGKQNVETKIINFLN